MNSLSRKTIGIVLLAISPITGLLLFFGGVPLVSKEYSQTFSSPSGSITSAAYKFHWPFVLVSMAGILGLILIVSGKREKTKMNS